MSFGGITYVPNVVIRSPTLQQLNWRQHARITSVVYLKEDGNLKSVLLAV